MPLSERQKALLQTLSLTISGLVMLFFVAIKAVGSYATIIRTKPGWPFTPVLDPLEE